MDWSKPRGPLHVRAGFRGVGWLGGNRWKPIYPQTAVFKHGTALLPLKAHRLPPLQAWERRAAQAPSALWAVLGLSSKISKTLLHRWHQNIRLEFTDFRDTRICLHAGTRVWTHIHRGRSVHQCQLLGISLGAGYQASASPASGLETLRENASFCQTGILRIGKSRRVGGMKARKTPLHRSPAGLGQLFMHF